jgi:hypothetical protein
VCERRTLASVLRELIILRVGLPEFFTDIFGTKLLKDGNTLRLAGQFLF